VYHLHTIRILPPPAIPHDELVLLVPHKQVKLLILLHGSHQCKHCLVVLFGADGQKAKCYTPFLVCIMMKFQINTQRFWAEPLLELP
jgi:hypothetical protein